MADLPLYICYLFETIVIGSIAWFFIANRSKIFLFLIITWLILQSFLSYKGVFQDTSSIPPKLMLFGIFPTLLIILLIFAFRKGRIYMDGFSLRTLTFFHTIRLFVEIVLSLLYHQKVMSVYITFEGTDYDIFSGISALAVGIICFKNGEIIKKKLLLWWNIICLGLLLNVVITAVFAFPSPFQKLAFDQPNIAVLHFPFSLLPTVVVPLVLFAHLIAIRKLVKTN